MSTFLLSSVFSSLAAFVLMLIYGIDAQTAGQDATLGGIAFGIAAWAIEDTIRDRKRKRAQEFEMKQILQRRIDRPSSPTKTGRKNSFLP